MYSGFRMINTLNESALHKKLKKIYANKYHGKTEIESAGKFFDIVCPDGGIIEIQTQNISKLKEKIVFAISKNIKLKIVFPYASEKKIMLYEKSGTLISEKKSPATKNIFDVFRELTGVCTLLLHENISVDALDILLAEKRVQTKEPVQSQNRKRRRKKPWLKFDKELLEIKSVKTFETAHDYLSLLPKNLPRQFSLSDLQTIFAAKKKQTEKIRIYLWVLVRMEIMKKTKNAAGKTVYRVKKTENKKAVFAAKKNQPTTI